MMCGVDAGGGDIGSGGGCHVAWAELAEVILSLRQECWHRYTARLGGLQLAGGGVLACAGGSKRKARWRWVATRRE